MSTRLFYVDESYDPEYFCLSAIGIKHQNWRDCFDRIKEHRKNLKQDYGIYIRKEIHARELISGRGKIAPEPINKHTRSRIYHGLLQLITTLPEVVLFNVCLEVKGRKDPQLDAWDRLLNRIERAMVGYEQVEIALRKQLLAKTAPLLDSATQDSLSLRLLDYAPRALIIADESRENEITKAYRKMTVFNPIPSRYGSWGASKQKNIPLARIIEDPVFKESHQSFFVQLADCAAFSLLKKEAAPTGVVAKYKIDQFFEECLASICFKRASRTDRLGIVRR